MTTPPDLSVIKAAAGELTAEAVARIIDPDEWIAADSARAAFDLPVDVEQAILKHCKRSLAKADAILTLTSSTTEALIARVEAAEGERDAIAKQIDYTGTWFDRWQVATAGAQAAEARVEKLSAELREVLEWAIRERAPLREAEINSIREALTPTGGQ